MSLKHLYGSINADGSTHSGSGGFTVVAEGNNNGEYTIVFAEPFTSMPAVVTDQNYASWDDFSDNGGYLTDNTMLIALNNKKCKVKTGADKTSQDRNWTFIAIGAVAG
jgi:hypothetical protein